MECTSLQKMTENPTFEQRAVIKYYTKLGKNATEIGRKLKRVYGTSTLAYSTIAKWAHEFNDG